MAEAPTSGPSGMFLTQGGSPVVQGVAETMSLMLANQPVPVDGPSAPEAMQEWSMDAPSSESAISKACKCRCKKSSCLKLYCDCFSAGRFCDGCSCVDCKNRKEHEAVVQKAVAVCLERNPFAFRPKVAMAARHQKGCHCKKSGCLKKYCECFLAGVLCSENCKCVECKNFDGSVLRTKVQLLNPPAKKPRVEQPLASPSASAPQHPGKPDVRNGPPDQAGASLLPPGESANPINSITIAQLATAKAEEARKQLADAVTAPLLHALCEVLQGAHDEAVRSTSAAARIDGEGASSSPDRLVHSQLGSGFNSRADEAAERAVLRELLEFFQRAGSSKNTLPAAS